MRGTRRLAGQTPSTGLPITPPVIPIVPVAPIVPIGPTPPSPRTPAPIVPPVSPSEVEITVARMRRLALCLGEIGDRLADGGEAVGDPGWARRRGLQSARMIGRGARRHCTEQERDAGRSGGNDPGQDPMIFLPQRHQIPLHRSPAIADRSIAKRDRRGQIYPTLLRRNVISLNCGRRGRRFTSCATNWANHYASHCASCPTRRYAIHRYATSFPRRAAVRLRLTGWLVRRARRPPREWRRAVGRPLGGAAGNELMG